MTRKKRRKSFFRDHHITSEPAMRKDLIYGLNFLNEILHRFWNYFIVNLCRQFFAVSERKVLDQNGQTRFR